MKVVLALIVPFPARKTAVLTVNANPPVNVHVTPNIPVQIVPPERRVPQPTIKNVPVTVSVMCRLLNVSVSPVTQAKRVRKIRRPVRSWTVRVEERAVSVNVSVKSASAVPIVNYQPPVSRNVINAVCVITDSVNVILVGRVTHVKHRYGIIPVPVTVIIMGYANREYAHVHRVGPAPIVVRKLASVKTIRAVVMVTVHMINVTAYPVQAVINVNTDKHVPQDVKLNRECVSMVNVCVYRVLPGKVVPNR